MSRQRVRHWWVSVAVLAAAIGCQGAQRTVTPDPVRTPASPSSVDSRPNERQGNGSGATLWAMTFLPDMSDIRAGTEVKIVWRMTGAGELAISATGPAGRSVTPSWGPEPHGESDWQRPGEEWGTGWLFPEPGSWTFHATRAGGGSGDLTVQVT